MDLTRRSGVLLHPTSLPGRGGIGVLGQAAYRWLDWLEAAGASVWQVLPLGPTGFGDSPYQSFSSYAGNPLLIDLEDLHDAGLITASELETGPDTLSDRVDYGRLIPWKVSLLDRALERMSSDPDLLAELDAFREAEAGWLDDYTLFRAIKRAHGERPWTDWPVPLRDRQPQALHEARHRLAADTRTFAFRQWWFFRQWHQVRESARRRNIMILGDLPLYVAHDSADVWVHRRLFCLEPDGRPRQMAGVPPDYFSPTGQLWGNPTYDWTSHEHTGFRWWIERMAATLRLVDIVRIDHFRGLVDFWAVPAGAPTAETGEWRPGPGRVFFDALTGGLGELPVVAEDLGDLSPGVYQLRDELGLPGMKILQFAFDGDPDNPFLPEHIAERAVVYTGTHDNDTTWGWFASLERDEQRRVLAYLDRPTGDEISWDLMALAWWTRGFLAVAPLQDVLGLDRSARMNTPGTSSGNWRWRARAEQLADESVPLKLRRLTTAAGRLVPEA